jgi:hypothetical protein
MPGSGKGTRVPRVSKCLERENLPNEGIEGITRKRRKMNVVFCIAQEANSGHVQIIQEQERKGDGREEERQALNEARNAECGRKVDRA